MARCPACKASFRKPLRPADAVGAAAYLQFCPDCLRELQIGSGIKIRIGMMLAIVLAWWAGFFDLGSPVVNTALRVAAILMLLAAWLFLPSFRAGPRRYNTGTGMADDVDLAQNDDQGSMSR